MVGVSSILRLVLILVSFCLISAKVVDFSEKSQLLELKKAILDPYNMLSTWKLTNSDHCSWFGVTCNARGRVSELKIPGGNFATSGSCFSKKRSDLSLHGFGIVRNCSLLKKGGFLGGKLLNLVGLFSELRVLSLPFNQISGELPSGILGLKNLEVIDLEGNLMTANISMINFGNLKNLQVLNLGFNRLFGEIPNSLSGCKNLSILNLAGNRISGSVPDFLGKFVKLKVINLSLNRFTGSLRDSFWSNCDVLEHVDFSANFFNGQIPNGLGRCSNLRTMLLFSNRFSGVLPFELGNLRVLQVLDASKNQISGQIPKSLASLRNLKVLLLNNNKLSGQIPYAFFTSKSRVKFNFSFNNLSGSIKVNHNAVKCNRISNRIIGNPLLHGCQFVSLSSSVPPEEPPEECNKPWAVGFDSLNNTVASDSSKEKKGITSFELILIIVPLLIIVILVTLVILYLYFRKPKPNPVVSVISPRRYDQQQPVVVFKEIGVRLTLDAVVQATGNFTSRNCIGTGGFGSTYRAEISPGTTVAVKRLTVEMCQGVPQFNAEIRSLGRIRHPNLVTLIGYYASTSEMFLIYNYLPGGNLEKFILEKRATLSGVKVVHKIALGVANALYFLHDQCHPRILHRDVKPSNILLDEDFNAYLSDFGLARLLDDFETHVTTDVAGTFGYVAPEYALSRRASEKADVYSYGVMLLELISGKRALDASFSGQENGYTIVTWAVVLWGEGRLEEVFTAGLWEAGPEDVLVELLHLGLLCTADSVTGRPTMRQVVRRLKQILPADSGS